MGEKINCVIIGIGKMALEFAKCFSHLDNVNIKGVARYVEKPIREIPEYLTNNSDRTNNIKLNIKKTYLLIILVFLFFV